MYSFQVGGVPMRWEVLAGTVLVLGCGSASSSRLESVTNADSGAPVADGGTVSVPDAGATADAGTPAAPDAGVVQDGGVAAECDALVPSPVAPIKITLETSGGTCGAASPDGTEGVVPLRNTTYDSSGTAVTEWTFIASANGRSLSTWDATPDGPYDLLPQPSGFIGVERGDTATGEPLIRVDGFAHDGTPGSRTELRGNAAFALDPNGGLAVVNARVTQGSTVEVSYWRFDATGAAVTTAVPIATADATGKPAPWTVVGVSVNDGHALVLWGFTGSASNCQAAWVDRDGQVTGSFQPPACRVQRLYPLLDGSLAVETYNLETVHSVTARVKDQSTTWDGAPAWISGASLRELFLLPGRRGYALRQNGPGRDLEVVAPGGNRCGTLRTAELDNGPLQLGRDGTLVEQDLRGSGCTFRWYPQVFK